MKKTLLATKGINKEFGEGREAVSVLDHVSVNTYEDGFTIIMGPSRAGKSALLYILSGMDRISSGTVVYEGKMISRFKESQIAKTRSREFGFVFQQIHLVSSLTLFENVTVVGYLGKEWKPEETRKQAEALLERMNVRSAKGRMPAEVSGGEAQRTTIARAMINELGIISTGEPARALSKRNTGRVLDPLTELDKEGRSILIVTHDLRTAVHGTRLLYLEDGKILNELSMPVFHPEDKRTKEAAIND